jgi:asparagine synthase (glutamine-hydrolysing)
MCGILFTNKTCNDFFKRLRTLQKRGPDGISMITHGNLIFGHTRLCIKDPIGGEQPIQKDGYILIHNGELYGNSSDISDSYQIIEAVKKYGMTIEAVNSLDGIFAFVIYQMSTQKIMVARDPIGVIPLYFAQDVDGVIIGSELKALCGYTNIEIFPPGHMIVTSKEWCFPPIDQYVKDYNPQPEGEHETGKLRSILASAVDKRLNMDVPWGVLLSGGLDSSCIASLISQSDVIPCFKGIHTFSIGLEGSQDLQYARQMADYIDSTHHEITYTIQEGLDIIPDVIRAIESYDVTTIRASIPMYILSSHISHFGVKTIFSGEGADELLAGYLYNSKCPNKEELHKECILKMNRLHQHDCLRCNKSTAVHGVETRVPFLSKEFVEYTMNYLDPKYKLHDGIEKKILREDFKQFLPHSIYSRKKEQFSDGVGSKWIESLKKYAEDWVTDQEFEVRETLYPFQTPHTKEAYMYRQMFEEDFQNAEHLVLYTENSTACSSENGFKWSSDFVQDPSAKSFA